MWRVGATLARHADRRGGGIGIGRQRFQPRRVDAAPEDSRRALVGVKPTLAMDISIAGRSGIAARAICNSASRSLGHSPMNLVVTCRLAGGLQWMRAVGLMRATNDSSLCTTSPGRSRAVKSRISDNCTAGVWGPGKVRSHERELQTRRTHLLSLFSIRVRWCGIPDIGLPHVTTSVGKSSATVLGSLLVFTPRGSSCNSRTLTCTTGAYKILYMPVV
jgi:hypothetical protein